jgi:hypothetical protein
VFVAVGAFESFDDCVFVGVDAIECIYDCVFVAIGAIECFDYLLSVPLIVLMTACL